MSIADHHPRVRSSRAATTKDLSNAGITGAAFEARTGTVRGLRGGWLALIATNVACATLTLLASLVLWSLVPVALGWHSTVVMTGSMQPRLHVGDVAIARPVPTDKIALGQVLLVKDPDHAGRLRLHRLVGFGPNGTLTLRGDANAHNDSSPVQRNAVLGVGVLRVPVIGRPVIWLREGDVTALGLTAAGLLGLVALLFLYRAEDDDEFQPAPVRSAEDSAPRWLHHAGAGTLVLALAVALLAAGGATAPARAAAFQATDASATSVFRAAPSFGCSLLDLAANPVFAWALDGSTGNSVADPSGNGRVGSVHGNASFGAAGPCGSDSAMTVSGTPAWVSTAADVEASSSLTVEIWFRAADSAGGRLIGLSGKASGLSAVSDRTLFVTDSGQVAFGLAGGRVITSATGLADGQWHLADATVSPSGIRLFVDGSPVAADPSAAPSDADGYWRVGYDTLAGLSGVTRAAFTGDLADASVFPRSLPDAQIAAHYAAR
jgi:signal peptidase I